MTVCLSLKIPICTPDTDKMVSCSSQKAMKLYITYILILVLILGATSQSSAIPKQEEHKSRVYDKKLSDLDHDEGGEHEEDYDHDAFLGKDEAKTFDELTPEESKERLGKIVVKIDKDNDGFVTEQELRDWIQYVQRRYITSDSSRMWEDHDTENNKLTWESYKKRTYGFTEEGLEPDHPNYSYKEMMDRDKRRWERADQDSDKYLDQDEFTNFLHPEEVEHMRDVVVMETLDDIDKDKDGYISLDEFIGDMWPNREGEEEPEWVKTEREQFSNYRDTNKDGRLDNDEVRAWIMPPDYDHTEAEVKHLFHEADDDRDGKLSTDEILEKYDLFVGSQATDFGEALMKHDEF